MNKLSAIKKKLKNIIARPTVIEPDARDKYLDLIELSYIYSMFSVFKSVENVPGHIVELGVGAGRNSILLGNLLKTTNQHGNAKYFGFDTFGSYTLKDHEENSTLTNRWENNSYEFVRERIYRHKLEDICYLIAGDIRETLPNFINSNGNHRYSPGRFFCRFVYIDTSSYTPTKIGLKTLYDCLSVGGIMSIDQRKQGGEWKGMHEFCEENSIKPLAGKNFNDLPSYILKS